MKINSADIIKPIILTMAFIGFMLAIMSFILSAATIAGLLVVGDFVLRER